MVRTLNICTGEDDDGAFHFVDLKPSNVDSTKELLKLCARMRSKVIHFISTIGVFATLSWDTIEENSIPDKHKYVPELILLHYVYPQFLVYFNRMHSHPI